MYLEAFECDTASDWLNHKVQQIKSCIALKLTNLREKDKECSWERLVNTDRGQMRVLGSVCKIDGCKSKITLLILRQINSTLHTKQEVEYNANFW